MNYKFFIRKTKNNVNYYYLYAKGFIPCLIKQIKTKFWNKVRDKLIDENYKYWSNVWENTSLDSYCNTGSEYTFSLQVPVNVVFLCIYKVYGTMFVPVNAIYTNINVINPAEDEAVVTIYTSRPGVFIGKGGKDIDALRESLKKMFNCKNLKVELEESVNSHKPYDYYDEF